MATLDEIMFVSDRTGLTPSELICDELCGGDLTVTLEECCL